MGKVHAPSQGVNTLHPTISSVVPDHLRNLKRWTAWKWIPPKKAGAKPGKYPLSLTNDSATWLSFGEALKLAGSHAGVGFQMMGMSSLVGLDLDGCRDAETEVLTPFAAKLLAALPDTYAEITPSGKGLRIFATLPEGAQAPPEFNASSTHGVECYVGKAPRYLTITGNVLVGREGKIADFTPEALRLLAPLAGPAGGFELEVPLPMPTHERVEEWQKIFDERLPYKKLKAEWRDYLEHGDIAGSRSERTFSVACRMIECRYPPAEIFLVLISAPGSWEAALDKRDQDPARARALVWNDIGRAQKIVRATQEEVASRADVWTKLELTTQYEGKRVVVLFNQMNATRILTSHDEWKGRIALDITTGHVLLDSTQLDDTRFFELQEKVTRFAMWGANSSRQWWSDVLRAVAEKNPINPREAMLRTLRWDGTPRLDSWFTDHVAQPLNATEDELNRVLGRKWLLSVVARWMKPGCKVDTVLILQGIEGAGKNTLFETIAGSVERVVNLEGFERDDKMALARSWIAEMPEAGLFRRAERERLKAFITKPVDQYRLPYAPGMVDVLRAFVIVSSSNSMCELFKADQDGLRRFWPVEVRQRINYKWVADHRDQLLAEAVAYLDTADMLGDETPWWFETTPAVLKHRVLNTLESSSVEDAIIQLIGTQAGKGGMRLSEIAGEVGVILGHRPNDRAITPLLEKHGLRRGNTGLARVWLHPSWARAEDKREADVIPLARPLKSIPVAKDEREGQP